MDEWVESFEDSKGVIKICKPKDKQIAKRQRTKKANSDKKDT